MATPPDTCPACKATNAADPFDDPGWECPRTECPIRDMLNQPEQEQLWIHYGYDDPPDAPIIQTADNEDDAREAHAEMEQGGCWYRYDVVGGKLENQNGPYHFDHEPA